MGWDDVHNPTVYGCPEEMKAVESGLPFDDPEPDDGCWNCIRYDAGRKEVAIQDLKLVYEYIRKEVHDIASRKCRMMDKVNDAIALLKEQEAVKPTWSRGKPFCGACGLRIRGGKFCSECGQAVKWE